VHPNGNPSCTEFRSKETLKILWAVSSNRYDGNNRDSFNHMCSCYQVVDRSSQVYWRHSQTSIERTLCFVAQQTVCVTCYSIPNSVRQQNVVWTCLSVCRSKILDHIPSFLKQVTTPTSSVSSPQLERAVEKYLGFEVLRAVTMKSTLFWDTTLCRPLKDNRRFGGTCCYHLQDRREI
jgi:hypothetical protein